jgi:hypothetical protein
MHNGLMMPLLSRLRPAIVQVQDETLEKRLVEVLEGIGVPCRPAFGLLERPLAFFLDQPETTPPGSAPVVQLWRTGRHRRSDSNPFEKATAYNWVGVDTEIDASIIKSTVDHLSTGRFIGLADLLGAGAVIESVREHESSKKRYHLERLVAFLQDTEESRHLGDALSLALDELFTNAAYNAPVAADGTRPNAARSRTEAVRSERPFTVRFGKDSNNIAISVRDCYGSLDVERVFSGLRRCFGPQGATFEEKEGGAGLGFFMLLQNATRLVINVKRNQFTEVIVLRRRGLRRADFMKSCPTLNVCLIDGRSAVRTSRRCDRESVSFPVELDHEGKVHGAAVLDISSAGAFVRPDAALQDVHVGDVLHLSFPRAQGGPLVIKASVRWIGQSAEHYQRGFGVQFSKPLEGPTLEELRS